MKYLPVRTVRVRSPQRVYFRGQWYEYMMTDPELKLFGYGVGEQLIHV